MVAECRTNEAFMASEKCGVGSRDAVIGNQDVLLPRNMLLSGGGLELAPDQHRVVQPPGRRPRLQ